MLVLFSSSNINRVAIVTDFEEFEQQICYIEAFIRDIT